MKMNNPDISSSYRQLLEQTESKVTDTAIENELQLIYGRKIELSEKRLNIIQKKVKSYISESLINAAINDVGEQQINAFSYKKIKSTIRLNGLLHNAKTIKDNLLYGQASPFFNSFSTSEVRLALEIQASEKFILPARIQMNQQDPQACIEAEGWMGLRCYIISNKNALSVWLNTLYKENFETWDMDPKEIRNRNYTFLTCMERTINHA